MAPTDAWWGWDLFNTSYRLSLERMEREMVNAKCYASRYPDLARSHCGGERDLVGRWQVVHCDIQGLLHHFREFGKQEGRRFRCKDASDAQSIATPAPADDARVDKLEERMGGIETSLSSILDLLQQKNN